MAYEEKYGVQRGTLEEKFSVTHTAFSLADCSSKSRPHISHCTPEHNLGI
jgi:hypothetical protein